MSADSRWNLSVLSACAIRLNKIILLRISLDTRTICYGGCICEWLQGWARLPTTHTLVKLTLCNGCYLIIENGRGRNQVSLCWGEKMAQQPVCSAPTGWGRCCPLYVKPVQQKKRLELVMTRVSFHRRERKQQRVSMSTDSHHDWADKEKSSSCRNLNVLNIESKN